MSSQATERVQNDQERRQQERESKERQALLSDPQNYSPSNTFPGVPTMPPGGALEAQTAWQAYFDLVDQSTRTARRVTEAMFINSQIQQIAQQVRLQVLADVRAEVQHQFASTGR